MLLAAKTMTDQAIADQLKALADEYGRRAEKVAHVYAARPSARATSMPKRSFVRRSWTRLMRTSTASRKKALVDRRGAGVDRLAEARDHAAAAENIGR